MVYQHTMAGTGGDDVTLTGVNLGGESFYKISRTESLRPFFMTIVSDSDHWLFVSSNGGISAGRKNAEYALFPYYTEDKITDSSEITGSKTILRVSQGGQVHVWEPFSARSEDRFAFQRNLYKSRHGHKIVFEEINLDLGLAFRYEWNSSSRFGFVRKVTVLNTGSEAVSVEVIDGLQNILPYGVGSSLQQTTSNLADAYKRSELLPDSGIGVFALSAIIVDKAEPSEALKANLVWSIGLDEPVYLLSTAQLSRFRKQESLSQETDVKGERGAYFVNAAFELAAGAEKNWMLVADVNKSQSDLVALAEYIRLNKNSLATEVLADVEAGGQNLVKLVAAADGLQQGADERINTRHFSNVLFNIMRGGIFDDNYHIDKADFTAYFRKANPAAYREKQSFFKDLPEQFSLFTLAERAEQTGDPTLIRLATEYLPLRFSRRHGDPSRPWNKFTINTRSETDGSRILDYEGNWRDIFQNWEALAYSYPAFIRGMIFKFLNASTFDGYNPYRVTKDGFDWETIEPDNPWSYIGYWGDHQVIYLQKFLECAHRHDPGLLSRWLNQSCFVYAHVPYRIKTYPEILKNPKDTILFSHREDVSVRQRMAESGSDAALLTNREGAIHTVNFTEKLLAMLLAKVINLVPGGGIWMNTQRPEWNDANNALVGNGLSMVTLSYLRRFLEFARPLFEQTATDTVTLSAELHTYFSSVSDSLRRYAALLPEGLTARARKSMLDELGQAGSQYREQIYTSQFSGHKETLPCRAIADFLRDTLSLINYTLDLNRREDGLYHTYNILSYTERELEISHLDEMLEGQVAVLSSGYLDAAASLQLLDALRNSALYREDQHSYLLYPNKELPTFLQKNKVPANAVESVSLLKALLADGVRTIIEKDSRGDYHFRGDYKNAGDLEQGLRSLPEKYQSLLETDRDAILGLYEQVFNHKAFTGRSGTFFAYEGLGSIYWHMVSKLLLAVQETCLRAATEDADPAVLKALFSHADQIRDGIGVHKSPSLYGAFPTDPYSHTPLGKGAQQPGMTGQVKEDILSRFGELGVTIEDGQVCFRPVLLRKAEFSATSASVEYINLHGEKAVLTLEPPALFFTYCQVPVIYITSEEPAVEIYRQNGDMTRVSSSCLSQADSGALFRRSGEIRLIKVYLRASALRD